MHCKRKDMHCSAVQLLKAVPRNLPLMLKTREFQPPCSESTAPEIDRQLRSSRLELLKQRHAISIGNWNCAPDDSVSRANSKLISETLKIHDHDLTNIFSTGGAFGREWLSAASQHPAHKKHSTS